MDKLTKPQIKALRFSSIPFAARNRRTSISIATWEALYRRGLVTRPPWKMTEKGREALLALVPPWKSNHQCRGCRRWLEGDWSNAKTPEERAEIQRQMNVGRCDDCTWKLAMGEVV